MSYFVPEITDSTDKITDLTNKIANFIQNFFKPSACFV